MTETIKLPTKKVEAQRVNPKRLVIYSKPKTGKTTAFAGLENNLIIDLENGSDYVDALKVKANSIEDLKTIGTQLKEANYPYKFVTILVFKLIPDPL